MKAVFDTNVLIAAFLTDGLCAKLLLRARRNEFSLILCPFILQEFQKFLQVKIKSSMVFSRSSFSFVIETSA